MINGDQCVLALYGASVIRPSMEPLIVINGDLAVRATFARSVRSLQWSR